MGVMADDDFDPEFEQSIGDLPFRVRRELVTTIKTEADRLAEAIKAAAPVKTGALRDSVQVRRRRNELDFEVTAGGDATTKEIRGGSGEPYDYALATEFGTSKEHAEPFFYPTARTMQNEIAENIAAAVERALNE